MVKQKVKIMAENKEKKSFKNEKRQHHDFFKRQKKRKRLKK